jgi:ubiquinone/menaquinone biosynthesis C-methylase UbiE
VNNAKEFYNLNSRGYVQKWDRLFVDADEPRHYLRRQFFAAVLEMSEIRAGSAVLEIGCGTGLVLKEILRYTQPVFGMDISEAMLRRVADSTLPDRKVVVVDDLARADAPPGAEVILAQGDFSSLRLPEKSFDRVIAVEVLRYIEDIDRCLAQCRAIMTEDARFVFTVTNPRSFSCFPVKYNLRKKFGLTDASRELLQYFVSEEELKTKIDKAGFHIVGFKRSGFLTMNPLARRFIRTNAAAAKVLAIDGALSRRFPFRRYFDTFIVAVKKRSAPASR